MLDLNARRAALAESGQNYETVALGADERGQPLVWHIRAELPARALEALQQGEFRSVLEMLIQPGELDGFLEQDPSMQEVAAIVTHIANVTTGNLLASMQS